MCNVCNHFSWLSGPISHELKRCHCKHLRTSINFDAVWWFIIFCVCLLSGFTKLLADLSFADITCRQYPKQFITLIMLIDSTQNYLAVSDSLEGSSVMTNNAETWKERFPSCRAAVVHTFQLFTLAYTFYMLPEALRPPRRVLGSFTYIVTFP